MTSQQILLAHVGTLLLEASRITGVVIAAPILWAFGPVRVRVAFVLMLSLVVHSSARPRDLGTTALIFGVASELLVGVAMGLVVRFIIGGIEMAGEYISQSMGLQAASLMDPHTQTQESGMTRIVRYFTLLLILILGIHRGIIGSLVASFHVVPPGSVADPSTTLPVLVAISVEAMNTGLRLAAPVIAVLLIAQASLAFISRAAPSLQIFSIGFALTIMGGGAVVFATLPDLGNQISESLGQTGPQIDAVLAALLKG